MKLISAVAIIYTISHLFYGSSVEGSAKGNIKMDPTANIHTLILTQMVSPTSFLDVYRDSVD